MVSAAAFQEADRPVAGVVYSRTTFVSGRFRLRFTRKSILDISVEYQFDNQQTFSRCFKKHFAESPSVYRHARKQDFSHLVRSLSAGQPGDIKVDRVTVDKGQYLLRGKSYAYHLDIEHLDKSHLHLRSGIKENFYKLLGGRPSLIYALTHFRPDGERVRVDYSLGVEAGSSVNADPELEPLPDIHGDFCRFCYSGKPVALNDHVVQIYTQILPELGLARQEGPDLTMFSYSLNEREELHLELQHLVPVIPLG